MHIKSTIIKNLVRDIRKSLRRFITIAMVTALGVGVFVGIKASAPDMRYTADKYYDNYNFMDLRIISEIGFDIDDINAVAQISEIESVQGEFYTERRTTVNAMEYVIAIHSLPDVSDSDANYINEIDLREGRLPAELGECVVEISPLLDIGINIGDTLTLKKEKEGDILQTNELKVVGKVVTPYYLSYDKGYTSLGDGKLDTYIYVTESCFSSPVYTGLVATVKNSDKLDTYSHKYSELIDLAENSVKQLIDERKASEIEELKKEYDQKIKESTDALEKAKSDYEKFESEGTEKLKDAKAALYNSAKALETAKEKLESDLKSAENEIYEKETQIASAKKSFISAKESFDSFETNYGDQIRKSEESINQLQSNIENDNKKLNEINNKLNDQNISDDERDELLLQKRNLEIIIQSNKQLKEQLIGEYGELIASYNEFKQQINEKSNQLNIAETQIKNLKTAINNKKAEFQNKVNAQKKKLEDSQKKYDSEYSRFQNACKEMKSQLEQGYKDLETLKHNYNIPEEAKNYVLDRNQNLSYLDYKLTTDRVDALASLFPIFFFLVSALVCSTTMRRIVDEQREVIGIYMAFGYTKWQIAVKYILYAALAGSIGGIMGLLIGLQVFPQAIYYAWILMYQMPQISYAPLTFLKIEGFVLGLAVVIISSAAACHSELRSPAYILLKKKLPKTGNRIFLEKFNRLWSKLSFSQKVSMRNLLRFKKRTLMTLLSIAGCCSLLVISLGMIDSIGIVAENQYNRIHKFNLNIHCDQDTSLEQKDSLLDQISRMTEISSVTTITQLNATVYGSSQRDYGAYFIIPQDTDNFDRYITLRERRSHKKIILDDSGAVISEKLADLMDVKCGDFVKISDGCGNIADVKIIAITENYLNHYIYMTSSAYEFCFNSKCEFNSILALLSSDDALVERKLGTQLISNDLIAGVDYYTEMTDTFTNMITSMNSFNVVIFISCGLLTFIVLYNLTNISILEKTSEISTIKILGFKDFEVLTYVYRENIILAVCGSLLGLALGRLLHIPIMDLMEQESLMFGDYISLFSYIKAFMMSMLFAAIVSIVVFMRLRKMTVIEAIKNID